MIIDRFNEFSDAQAPDTVAAHASTNVVDLKAAGALEGKPYYAHIKVNTTVTSDGSATVTFALQTDSAENFGSAVTLWTSSAIGKSTLVAGLVARGFGYLSDEAAVFGPDLTLTPSPRAIGLGEASLAVVPEGRRVLITDHDAFGYFAATYGFTVAGVAVPGGSTDAEASSAQLAKVAAVVKQSKVPAIFSNTAVNPAVVEAIAKESGADVKVVPLFVDSVGGPGSGAETYSTMMLSNASAIANALK